MKKHRILELQHAIETPVRANSSTGVAGLKDATGALVGSPMQLELLAALVNALPAILEIVRAASAVDSMIRNGFVASVHSEALTRALRDWENVSGHANNVKLRQLWAKYNEASNNLNSAFFNGANLLTRQRCQLELMRAAEAMLSEACGLGMVARDFAELTARWEKEAMEEKREEEGPVSE